MSYKSLLVVLLVPLWVGAVELNQDLQAKLISTLISFARGNNVEDDQMLTMLGELALKDRKVRIGGVGIIDRNISILLSEPRNSIVVSGKKWEGRSSKDKEIVLTDGRRVLTSIGDADISSLKIVIFSPTEARFIDLSSNTGGVYVR